MILRFARFKGESDTGVIKLTQAMGGGKTHSMLALALLAQNPEIKKNLSDLHMQESVDIRVVRSLAEKMPVGWSGIAEQLGKKEFFKDYYCPLLRHLVKSHGSDCSRAKRLAILLGSVTSVFGKCQVNYGWQF